MRIVREVAPVAAGVRAATSSAAPAVTEWCEELREHIGATGAEVELEFDEFRMVATIRASGSPTDGAGADEPGASELDPSLARAVATIARRYDCVARPIGRHGVSLAFEH